MKFILLTAAAAVAIGMPAAAHAISITLGGPLAVHCYEAALERDTSVNASAVCDRSLREESLDREDRAATLVNRGVLHMIRGELGAASQDFDAAMALDPSSPDAPLNKGFLYLRQGQGSEAVPLLNEAMERRARRQALALFARGIAHEQTGNFKAAYADLVRARDLEPEWSMPVQALARYEVRGR